MNTISGRITLKETGIGIPDLLVVIYDVDPRTQPEELIGSSNDAVIATLGQGGLGDRIGSVATDTEGRFQVTYEDSEFQIRNEQEKRPDLLLMAVAPESPGVQPQSRLLYLSNEIRQNAGRSEHYLIQLTIEQLKVAGIPIPSSPADIPEEPQRVIDRLVNAEERRTKIEEGVTNKIQKVRIEKLRQRRADFNTKLKPHLIETLSRVPAELRKSETFVAEGESVKEKTFKTIKKGLKIVNNDPDSPVKRAPIKGYISLSEEQLQTLKNLRNENGESYEDAQGNLVDVPADRVDAILREGASTSDHTDILRDDPVAKYCLKKTIDDICPEEKENVEENDSNGGNGNEDAPDPDNNPESGAATDTAITGNGVSLATKEDVPRYVATLMQTMTPPESSPTLRPDQSAIQENIDNFSLSRGPADTSAFYDFHNLQIAFEHVWQEAIDQGLLDLGGDAYDEIVESGGDPENALREAGNPLKALRLEAKRIFSAAMQSPGTPGVMFLFDQPTSSGDGAVGDYNRLFQILKDLEKRVRENFNFTVYAANEKERSVNLGIVVTYRQKWEPQNYQVGELVKTITLAPKEARKFSKKTVVKKKRYEKEVENNLSIRKEEASETSRAEDEIIKKTYAKTNFRLTTQGSFDIGIAEGKQTTSLTRDAGRSSDEIKKDFREAVFKSAQEYKRERTLEIGTEETFEEEFSESGEIMNPNDELAVTFLFYELQRRYKVNERIHRLRPVVLVAQEMPNPGDIDEDWLITHDWILRRVILDDSFLPTLDYLASGRVGGDMIILDTLLKNLEDQRALVQKLEGQLHDLRSPQILPDPKGFIQEMLEAVAEKNYGPEWRENEEAVRMVFGESVAKAVAQRKQAIKEIEHSIEREATLLSKATDDYTAALKEHKTRQIQIARLRVHIKQNILYYMQAIWLHEPPDQRFFRLHKVPVPIFEEKSKSLTIKGTGDFGSFVTLLHLEAAPHVVDFDTTIKEPETEFETADLVEVADLDNLQGFKGNYMIFPLKKSNPLTEFMMEPYIDRATGELIDPDPLGNINLDEFAKYVCCLKNDLSPERFEEIKPQLEDLLKTLLTSPLRNREDLIVPSGSLYIEALPAKHPILEDFKLMHRAIDVKKVQAEVREAELENIRAAARLIAEDYEDPDIDKKIVIEGNSQNVIVPPGDE